MNPCPGINAGYLSHKYRRILVSAKNMANWPRYISGRQCGGRDLVEWWLKTVIILPID